MVGPLRHNIHEATVQLSLSDFWLGKVLIARIHSGFFFIALSDNNHPPPH